MDIDYQLDRMNEDNIKSKLLMSSLLLLGLLTKKWIIGTLQGRMSEK